MASAVLASGNEPAWVQSGGGFMGKIPYLNPNPNPSLNPNSNPKKKQKHFHHKSNGGRHNNLNALPDIAQTVSDDAHSFVRKPVDTCRSNGYNQFGYLTYNISTYSKSEISELRRRLISELEQIRVLRDRIDSGQLNSGLQNPESRGKSKKLPGNKRPGPPRSIKDSKALLNGFVSGPVKNVNCVMDESLVKQCRPVLAKLMKHKFGWAFNVPVDAVALNLHDYHQVIKQPMDLGTVKTNLANNVYLSPLDFAADVRLTFNNAILYNPHTDDVHIWAQTLLAIFEDKFRPIQNKIDLYKRDNMGSSGLVEELQGSSWNHIPTPERVRKQKTSPISRKQERIQSQSRSSTPLQPLIHPKVQSPVPVVSPTSSPPSRPQAASQTAGRAKQPKPKAKDPNKREMSLEEKHKLGEGLLNLPHDKMEQVVQIIRKRHESLAQEGDEIELDIEALDTETLWELDRFVTNWKKASSKTKRLTLMGNGNNPTASIYTSAAEVDQVPAPAVDQQVDQFPAPAVDQQVDQFPAPGQFHTSAAEVDQAHTLAVEVDRAHISAAEVDQAHTFAAAVDQDHTIAAEVDQDHTIAAEVDQAHAFAAEVDQEPANERNDFVKRLKKTEFGDEDVDIGDDMPATSFPAVEIEKDEAVSQDNGNVTGNGNENGNGNAASSSSSSSSGSSSDSSSSSDSDSGSSSGSDSDADDAAS